MFSWAGFIVVAVALSLVIVVVRGVIGLVDWLIEVFVREPREMAKIREIQKGRKRSTDASSAALNRDGKDSSTEKGTFNTGVVEEKWT